MSPLPQFREERSLWTKPAWAQTSKPKLSRNFLLIVSNLPFPVPSGILPRNQAKPKPNRLESLTGLPVYYFKLQIISQAGNLHLFCFPLSRKWYPALQQKLWKLLRKKALEAAEKVVIELLPIACNSRRHSPQSAEYWCLHVFRLSGWFCSWGNERTWGVCSTAERVRDLWCLLCPWGPWGLLWHAWQPVAHQASLRCCCCRQGQCGLPTSMV